MKALYRVNGTIKTQEYATDWVEKKTFLWNVNANLPIGTEYWILSDADVTALEGIPESEYENVMELSVKPDGVSVGREAYEKLHPKTAIPMAYQGTYEEWLESEETMRSQFEITEEEFNNGNQDTI